MNRLIFLAIALTVGSVFVVPLAEALEPILAAFAVLLVVVIGIGLIIRAPFGGF